MLSHHAHKASLAIENRARHTWWVRGAISLFSKWETLSGNAPRSNKPKFYVAKNQRRPFCAHDSSGCWTLLTLLGNCLLCDKRQVDATLYCLNYQRQLVIVLNTNKQSSTSVVSRFPMWAIWNHSVVIRCENILFREVQTVFWMTFNEHESQNHGMVCRHNQSVFLLCQHK